MMAILVETRSRVSESVFGIVTTFYATTVHVVHMHVAGRTVATPPESVCIPVPGSTIIDRHSHFPLY